MAFLVRFFPFLLAWSFVTGNIRKDKIVFLQKSPGERNEILLVMTWTENEEDMTAGCEIFTDEELINKTLVTNDFQIRTLPEDEMQVLLGDCLEFNHQRKKRDTDRNESTEVSEDDTAGDYDELSRSRTNGRSNRRRGSRNRTSNKRTIERDSKPNNRTTSTRSPKTTSVNEIEDGHDKWNRQRGSRNRTAPNSELESESEESFDTNVTTTEPSTTIEPATTLGYDGLPIIFPGTKWCGAGDIAKNYDDLGTYEDTDRCCRAHDLCNDTIAPGDTKNGLTNTSPFTKLCCRCDEAFYNCLEKVHSIPANTIGNLYFNILRRECYKKDYPPANTCKKYLTLFKLTCLEYEKDTDKEKEFQWITPKRYRRT